MILDIKNIEKLFRDIKKIFKNIKIIIFKFISY